MTTARHTLARAARNSLMLVLIVGSGIVTLAMLAVMISLSVTVAESVFLKPAQRPIVFAPPAAGQTVGVQRLPVAAPTVPPADSTSDEGASTSVANAMTAVGTAIAAVTLLLSVGTTWFAMKLKDVEQATLALEKANAGYARLLEDGKAAQERREETWQALIDARFGLRQWIDRNSATHSRYSLLSDLSAHIELLMSSSEAQRLRSFRELMKFLPERPGELLRPVETYMQRCHELHAGTETTHGVWCRVFDPVERAAFHRATSQSGEYF